MPPPIVVVGGGAAGLMAAIAAGRAGARVVLLEKNQQPGLKILISGGGRCNLTTTKEGEALEHEYGKQHGRWLRHALRAFPPAALRAEIEAAGVPLHEEDLEKVFPDSQRARDIVDALLRIARAAGVEVACGAPLLELSGGSTDWRLRTPAGELAAGRVVLATGGVSYPKTGTTGDGQRLCARLGHRIVPLVPALAPLAVDEGWLQELAGIALEAELTLRDRAGAVVRRRRRPILFTHRGLSGPAAMDLAGDVEERGGGCRLQIDFAPDASIDELDAGLARSLRAHGRRQALHVLPLQLPERLRATLCDLAGVRGPAAEVRREQRLALARQLKATCVRVERSLGFAHAEVTRGGVALEEVDARTMQSRVAPGLFLCGEILDVDGPIGGFNFQSAFATGRLAGLHAAAATPPDRTAP
jgi:hypothetical protein